MTGFQLTRSRLAAKALLRVVTGFGLLSAMLFLSAGTWGYWEAWVYITVLVVPVVFVVVYLLLRDPGLLERRMRWKEKHSEQSLIVKLGSVCYLLVFLIPGFDRRFEWSEVPSGAVFTADLIVLLSFGLFVLVLRENSYASRIVEVEPGQRVVTTGPYATVRHPMYLGALVTFSSTPLALGSWWGLILVVPLSSLLVFRIREEERLLRRELEGYQEYTEVTRYRLIPGIW